MANVHRIGEDGQGEQRRFNRVYQYQQLGPNARRIPFLAPFMNYTTPRDESYWDMLRLTFCPRFKCFSLTTFLLLVNTVLFIICVKEGILREGTLLQVKEEVLVKWGAMVPSEVKSGQFWLLFTSLFLSFDFLQYFINIVMIMVLCSAIEESIGAIATGIVYIGGGILGALFGAMVHCCIDYPYVETQAAIYAMLGGMIGFFILNWDALETLQDLRCFLLCLLIMLTFLILLMTLSSTNDKSVDKIGSVGGLMAGFFLTLAVAPPVIEGTYEKKCCIFGWTFAGIQTFICILMLLLVVQ